MTEFRDRPVNGEPREDASRGSLFFASVRDLLEAVDRFGPVGKSEVRAPGGRRRRESIRSSLPSLAPVARQLTA